jgi:hypothetical protein
MAFCILAGILHSIFTPLLPLRTVATLHPHHMAPATLLLLARVSAYAFVVFECACIWGYWAGVEWARILVLIDCFLIIFALYRLPATWHRYPGMAVLEIGKVFLAVFLLWYLFQPQVRAWFAQPSKDTKPDAPDTPAPHAPPAT